MKVPYTELKRNKAFLCYNRKKTIESTNYNETMFFEYTSRIFYFVVRKHFVYGF